MFGNLPYHIRYWMDRRPLRFQPAHGKVRLA
jgi:hypothetical protein